MVTPVTKAVGFTPTKDYGSVYDLEALNLDLVALDQSYTVNVEGVGGNVAVAGWTTDATRFLKFIGPLRPDVRIINPANILERACLSEETSTANTLLISGAGIGANGYIEFQNFAFNNQSIIYCVSISVAGTFRFINCIFYNTNTTGGPSAALNVNHANASIECINCIFVAKASAGVGNGARTQACKNTSKFYHCHFIGGNNGIDLNNQTVTLKNCYAYGTTAGYANKAASALTKCAANDATASEVGLQNVAWDITNWASMSAGSYQDPEPLTAPCMAGGADVSGDAAPFNVSADFCGRAYVIASPSIGCRQYIATNPRVRHLTVGIDPGTVAKQSGLSICDFTTLAIAAAVNKDLVASQERWIIECTNVLEALAVVFNGWNTNSTYYLQVRNSEYSQVRKWNDALSKNAITTGFFSVTKVTIGDLLTVGDIGATGLLVFEGIQLHMNHASASNLFTNSALGTGGKVQFKRCKLINTLATAIGRVINGPAGGGNIVELVNCTLVHASGFANTAVDWNANVLRAHHCSVFLTNVGATVKTGFDMHGTAGCAVKNTHVHLVNPAGGSNCYLNMAGVDFVKCSSSDATGTEVGLQNIPYDVTNWIDISTAYMMYPKSTGLLARTGTDLSAQPDPLNCTHDHHGTTRSSVSPTIGAFECSVSVADYTGSWVAKQVGFNLVKDEGVAGIIKFSIDSKLYAYMRHRAGQPSEIYSSSDNGDTWVFEYDTGAVLQHITGAAEFGGNLYFCVDDSARIIKFDPTGPTWSTSAANLGGAAGAPTAAQGLFVAQAKIWCVLWITRKLYNSPDGAVWTQVTLPGYVTPSSGLFACTTPAGDVILVVSDPHTILWLKNGTAVWGQLAIGYWMDISNVVGSVAYDSTNQVIYITGSIGPTSSIGVPSGVRVPIKIDTIAKTAEAGYTMTWIASSANTHWWNGIIRYDLWWGSYQATTSSGYLFSINASDIPGNWRGYVTMMNEGVNLSGPSKNAVQSNNSLYANGYSFFGVRTGTVQYAAIMRSPLVSNAHKMDDASLRNGLWNTQKYAFSVMSKSSASDAPYERSGIAPGSGTDSAMETRRVDNYFSAPTSYTWRQLQGSIIGIANWRQYKEDLARFYHKVYKDFQPIKMQAPCLISGSKIPIAFVDPAVSKAAESLVYSNVAYMNNFVLKFRWTPIHDPQALEADVNFVTIGGGADYIRLVERAVSYGTRPQEREYFAGDRYGRHDPVWAIQKVIGGMTVSSHSIYLYSAYPGENESGDVFGDDTWEFEIVNVMDTVFGVRIKSAGLMGEWWAPNSGTADYPTNPTGNVTFAGYGYFGAPEILNSLDEEIAKTGPARKLLTGRTDVARLLCAEHVDPLFMGDRDSTEGILTLDNPFLNPEGFDRPDAASLGGKWSTITRAGAGWYLLSSNALCSGYGIEKWSPAPRHSAYAIGIQATITVDNNFVGVIGRHEYNESLLMGYSAELIQTGVAAASLNLCRWYKGVKTVLLTQALSSYTAGTLYLLMLMMDGTTLTGVVTSLPGGVFLALATTNDSFFTKPGVAALYGFTGGPAEIISVTSVNMIPNFDNTVAY